MKSVPSPFDIFFSLPVVLKKLTVLRAGDRTRDDTDPLTLLLIIELRNGDDLELMIITFD